ncbi:hypothetical protein H6P81_013830 [Aristolochia fimbriata]|uniref:Uncharacterized protein n=1 Tax=Aristolochia fimbriata TaxID=158543 RepID=A0AAV7EJE3_ARIFI|nr:hypothetical protein H6P81_013830 [Aristolochia fimbriata]
MLQKIMKNYPKVCSRLHRSAGFSVSLKVRKGQDTGTAAFDIQVEFTLNGIFRPPQRIDVSCWFSGNPDCRPLSAEVGHAVQCMLPFLTASSSTLTRHLPLSQPRFPSKVELIGFRKYAANEDGKDKKTLPRCPSRILRTWLREISFI